MILGIDPGFGGALAWYSPASKDLVALMPMPTIQTGSVMLGGADRREIDTQSLAKLIRAMPPTLVIVEHVSSSPQMGVASSFRFGEGFGQLRGVLAALGHTTRLVKPAVWKSILGLSANKAESVTMACKLWPDWCEHFIRGKSSADLAEAALLAHYGEKLLAPKAGPWKE